MVKAAGETGKRGRPRKKDVPSEAGVVHAPDPEVLPAETEDQSGSGIPEPAEAEELSVADVVIDDDAGADEDAQTDGRGIVRYDPLRAYLKEISRFMPLSREEERDLAIRYYKEKDIEAAYKLISGNLWLVVKLAREYERAARSLLDLIQEGNIGLMEAVKNFDPYRGVRFPSYAAWWVKAYIIRFVIANWRLVKIGTTQAQRKLFFNLKKEKEKLEREGFYPGPKLLAEKLNVKEAEVVEMEQRLGSSDLSVDTPVGDESDASLLSFLPSGQPNAEDLMAKRQMRGLLSDSLRDFASTLNEKERLIFEKRMLGEEKATLQDIAEVVSLSKERVRQIEEKIKGKLKDYLLERLGASVTNIEFD